MGIVKPLLTSFGSGPKVTLTVSICINCMIVGLQAMPNSTALIINHENISHNWYMGKDRNFLVAGALFRLGGGAALMSNRYETSAAIAQESFTLSGNAVALVGQVLSCSCGLVAHNLELSQNTGLLKRLAALLLSESLTYVTFDVT